MPIHNPYGPDTQLRRLLDFFAANPNRWHDMPKLVEICSSHVVHSKVAELRRLNIGVFENRIEHFEGKVSGSFYRFTPINTEL